MMSIKASVWIVRLRKAPNRFCVIWEYITTAIIIFLRQVIQYQGLPFDVRLDENRKLLQALTDLDQNIVISQSFESVSQI